MSCSYHIHGVPEHLSKTSPELYNYRKASHRLRKMLPGCHCARWGSCMLWSKRISVACSCLTFAPYQQLAQSQHFTSNSCMPKFYRTLQVPEHHCYLHSQNPRASNTRSQTSKTSKMNVTVGTSNIKYCRQLGFLHLFEARSMARRSPDSSECPLPNLSPQRPYS